MIAILFRVLSVVGIVGTTLSAYFLVKLISTEVAEGAQLHAEGMTF
jgi:hypothetical protein